MIDQAISIARLTPTSKMSRGCAAKFVVIDDQWGFKFYDDDEERDKCVRLQKIAHEHGIGPAVGDLIEFELNGMMKYGYITEIAAILMDTFAERLGFSKHCQDWGNDEWTEYRHYRRSIGDEPKLLELMKKMRQVGLSTDDMHLGNMGYLPDGRLVCIDFNYC